MESFAGAIRDFLKAVEFPTGLGQTITTVRYYFKVGQRFSLLDLPSAETSGRFGTACLLAGGNQVELGLGVSGGRDIRLFNIEFGL